MKRVSVMILTLALTGLLFGRNPGNNEAADSSETAALGKQNQLILWTSGDREVALKMVFMYSYYCKKRAWMDTVRLLVWGPSSKLITDDAELQEKLKELKQPNGLLSCCDQIAQSSNAPRSS